MGRATMKGGRHPRGRPVARAGQSGKQRTLRQRQLLQELIGRCACMPAQLTEAIEQAACSVFFPALALV